MAKRFLNREVFGKVKEMLSEALRSLAGTCDGASTRDGVGFNKYDSDFGHQLAREDSEHWSLGKAKTAYKLVYKYRVQLDSIHGVDLAEIPDLRSCELASGSIDFDGDVFKVTFGYDKETVADILKTWGRKNSRWNPGTRCWEVVVQEVNVEHVPGFAAWWDLAITDDANTEVDRLTAELSAMREQPWLTNGE